MTQPEPISWTIHLAARRPGRAITALLLIVFGLFALHALGEKSWVVLAIAALILLASIAEFLFPVTYRLDATGAEMRLLGSRRHFSWGRVRRVYLRRNAVQLSPFARKNWLDNYRGLLLRTSDAPGLNESIRNWLQYAGLTESLMIEES